MVTNTSDNYTMPEYALGLMFSGLFAVCGLINRKIDLVERRQDQLELKVAEKYVSYEEFNRRWDVMLKVFMRIEDKIDAHVSEDSQKIRYIKEKYNL